MKMGAGLFWGLILILIGLGLIIKIVFNLDIPLIKIIIAFFFILIGLRILIGDVGIFRFKSDEKTVVFSETIINDESSESKEYNVIFGKGVYDLRNIVLDNTHPKKLKLQTVFGSALVKVNKDTPLKLRVETAFGGANMPDGHKAAFGSSQYKSENFNADSTYLYIDAEVVFGNFEIRIY